MYPNGVLGHIIAVMKWNMTGDEFDKKLARLQNVVSLLKDLILAVTVAISCFIVYFGGDVMKLTILDWTKLLGAASLIVIGPIVVFFVWRLFLKWSSKLLLQLLSLYSPSEPVPTGLVKWYFSKLFEVQDTDFETWWPTHQAEVKKFSEKHKSMSGFITWWKNRVEGYFAFRNRVDPFMLALSVLIIGVLVFYRIISVYLPK
jgi:hypothetical protein